MLAAEVCVLDDISRAPPEALHVLLGVLHDRHFKGQRIPLVTVVATANPSGHTVERQLLLTLFSRGRVRVSGCEVVVTATVYAVFHLIDAISFPFSQ